MKNDMLGLIFAENPEVSMGELTNHRALAAVPFGGRYRIIDFILSNMVNSSVINVGIATTYNHQSLSDHLETGKAWDLDRKNNGLFILPPKESRDTAPERKGGLDIINGAKNYFDRSRQEYVVVSDCNTICNISFDNALRKHIETEADITMICSKAGKLSQAELKRNILLDVNDDGVIEDIQVYPSKQKSNMTMTYMHMFIIRKELLIDLTDDAVAHGKHYISKDIFLANMKKLKFCAYEFSGYQLKIDDVKSFFTANLQLLDKNVRDELFGYKSGMPIYTKVKDTVPTRYGTGAQVSNSMIADGCLIEGTVKNCILFRGVHIAKGASVENCIIMQNSEVMENCMMSNVIFDKEVVLRSGKKLIGQDTYPMVIGKRTVI